MKQARRPQDAGPSSSVFWSIDQDRLLLELHSSVDGLTDEEAASRASHAGGQRLVPIRAHGDLILFWRQFRNPIVLILIAATLVSFVLRDVVDALIILAIVVASALLTFWQERAAGQAVARLLAQVAVEVEVRRNGRELTIPLDEVVPGDIVLLNAGDVIPGDGRVLESVNLLVDESALTGESFPAEKRAGTLAEETPDSGRTNAVFLGSHVVSGEGAALIVKTGEATEFGGIASQLGAEPRRTSFERGIQRFGYLLARATAVLVVAVFAVNLLLDRPLIDSFLFSLALAVGLTPQLLPAIVAISLSTGARAMAREQVIVKRLDAIEDFGGMTVLCTDKTGTLTEGVVTFAGALDPLGREDPQVRRLAWLNARFQRGYANPIDGALLATSPFDTTGIRLLGEIPYDFIRKRLSVLVEQQSGPIWISKGSLEPLVGCCGSIQIDGGPEPLDQERRDQIAATFRAVSELGFRVLGVATRQPDGSSDTAEHVERDMTFAGFLLFSDPPKEGAVQELAELNQLGISVRIVTGDNRFAAEHAARAVGLASTTLLTGGGIANMTDAQLESATTSISIFAEIDPSQKVRIVRALQSSGEVTGFLGDGINDAPALHAADVGISVDSAVDVARQTAAIVLLDKQLSVIADGVRLGRVTFANTLKYIRVTTSANFGNMLSMAAAAAFLPFLPLLPRQILLLNFLSDIPGTTIARDRVDAEYVLRPQAWDVASIRSFMILFGTISSVFDITTFAVLRLGFDAGPALFRSGWFVESTMTELAVMLVLRTRMPFYRSRPGTALLVTSGIVAAVTLALPFSRFAHALGLRDLPAGMLLALAVITAGYIIATEAAKHWSSVFRLPVVATPNIAEVTQQTVKLDQELRSRSRRSMRRGRKNPS